MKNPEFDPLRRNEAGKDFILAGSLLIIIALLITFIQLLHQQKSNQSVLEEYEKMSLIMEKEPNLATVNQTEFQFWGVTSTPTIRIDDAEYAGFLTIDSLSLELPIQSTWSESKLEKTPCIYFGTAYTKDLVIAAHNYSAHFGKLNQVFLQDKLSFTDVDGNVFYYVVQDIEVINDTAVREVTSGEWDLTLFTCTASGNARLAIRCELLM